MESNRVNDEGLWDVLRLRDIQPGKINYGSKLDDYRVIGQMSAHLLQCKCTYQLLPYLEGRKILSPIACKAIHNRPESEAAQGLVKVLTGIALEPGRHHIVENLYLALYDCYEGSQNIWCRSMAKEIVRPAVMMELKISDINYYDLNVVLQRLSSRSPILQNASQLKSAIGLKDYSRGTTADLKQIVRQGINEKPGFRLSDLVSGLLLTPMLGRYVALLLPYCCCNSPEVYGCILSLQHNWTLLASYMGYSETEIQDIARAGRTDMCKQVQLFMRVWWMPCLGEDKTNTALQQVIHKKLGISETPLATKDDGISLLKACKDGDWQNATKLVERGNPLGARNEDGRTPLMYACLRGQERLVQLLLDKGADPKEFDKRGDVCLHFPETLRNRTILESILGVYKRLGTSVDTESLYSECSPLSNACKCGAVNSAELLLAHGANPNGCKNGKHRPLVEASAQGHVGLVRSLLAWKANVDATDKNGFTPLLQACTSNHWSVAQVLMDEAADVNKCGTDCTGPLFLAVSANAYSIASRLIAKGAVIDAVRFEAGASDDLVEMTPLCHAARNGMDSMVKLLIDSGANVNYLCSEAMPALGFSILGDHIETFHLLLDCANLDKSLTGLSPSIIISVKTENYYCTEKLLDTLGGAHQALVRAQKNQMGEVAENILMYMQAVNHDQLSEVGLSPNQYQAAAVPSRQIILQPGEQYRIDHVLNRFSAICVSAIRNSPEIPHESLAEIARATGNAAAAAFFRRMFVTTFTPDEMRCEFLYGAASPLRFLIQNKILTAEIFQVEVLKFHHDNADQFYNDLVWTFHHLEDGAGLPANIDAMLIHLFSGRFTPRVPKLRAKPPAPAPVVPERNVVIPDKARVCVSKPFCFRGINSKLRYKPYNFSPQSEERLYNLVKDMSTSSFFGRVDSDRSNVAGKESKSVENVLENNAPFSDTDTDLGTPPQLKQPLFSEDQPPNIHVESLRLEDNNVPGSQRNAKVEAATDLEVETASEEYSDEEKDFRLPNCTVYPTGTHLGHGSYGDVVEVQYKGKMYAAKKYRHIAIENLIGIFGREHEILSRLRHRNIVPYYGICKLVDGTTVIIMERMAMNLQTFLEERNNANLRLAVKFQLLFDIAKGLHHLHKQTPAVIHRDLTATNVLLNSRNVAKIGDFGNSRTVDFSVTPELLTSNPGTLDYMPPEALDGGHYSASLDVFSFGHLSIYVLIQHRPHPLLRPTFREHGRLIPRSEVERRTLYLNEVKQKLDGAPQHTYIQTLLNCLHDEPNSRPSCSDILSSRVFLCCNNNSYS